jgi:SAM-dependent methyltransferase
MNIHRCRACNLVFINPIPSPGDLENIYKKTYYDSWGGEQLEGLVKKQKIAYFSNHIKTIKNLTPGGNLLDVGCAKGYFVELALREGYSAYGLEISEYAAEIAARAVGKGRVEVRPLEHCSHPSDTFDVITMFDYLEHVPNLSITLSAASRLLKENGILYIVTPNSDSLSCKIMRGQWWHYKEEHLYYFNRRSLTKLLERHGFQGLESNPSKKTLSVEYLLHQLGVYPVVFLSPILKTIGNLMPTRFRNVFLTLPSGEFYTIARKQ